MSNYHDHHHYAYNIPIGIRAIQILSNKCCSRLHFRRELLYKSSILFLTYISYTCYHMSRKPISVVKSVLHRNCSAIDPPLIPINQSDDTWCNYPPFDRPDANLLFSTLESAFLFSYSIAMFFSGFIAERVSLRYFLSSGMILSALFTYLFGIAKPSNIHSMWYFIFVQIFAGIFQTTGWPGVVTLVGRWFGKSKRGLIFGIWNSHISIGNILGSLIAALFVEGDWSLSFIVPAIIMGAIGFILFLFVVDSPEMVGCQQEKLLPITQNEIYDEEETHSSTPDSSPIIVQDVSYRPTERTQLLGTRSSLTTSVTQRGHAEQTPITLLNAIHIPGVLEFAFCLFFSKLVSYTFLYWLPLYIQSSTTLGATLSADISTLFDFGAIVGAITAGMISDCTAMPATTCAGMLFLAAPMLLIYYQYGNLSISVTVILLFVAGILVNGPYALITTSVSAELGQHSSLEGNSKALATVTAIIDGTGSIGAAVGPLLVGVISSSKSDWQSVFYMLICSDLFAMLLLVRLVIKEFSRLRHPRIE